jgi:predicted dehydrogenase
MTGVAICGIGNIGKVHLDNLLSLRGCRVTGIYDIDSDELARVASAARVRVYRTGEELLEDSEAQAVIIATPSSSHREWCVRALAAGKHVFVEKPLAGTLPDARAIVEAARNSDRVVQAGFCERFNSQYLEARRAVCCGDLGEVRAIHSSRWAPYEMSNPHWEMGVLDTAVHNLDLILWLMQRMPQTVLARGVRVYPDAAAAHNAWIVMTFEGGAMAVDNIAWVAGAAHPLSQCARSRMMIHGNSGSFEIDLNYRPSSLLRPNGFRGIDSVIIGGPEYYGCLKLQFEYFLKSIEEGTPVLAPVEDALATERVALAALASLRSGREVRLEEIA